MPRKTKVVLPTKQEREREIRAKAYLKAEKEFDEMLFERCSFCRLSLPVISHELECGHFLCVRCFKTQPKTQGISMLNDNLVLDRDLVFCHVCHSFKDNKRILEK
jgi:hypothetical protein